MHSFIDGRLFFKAPRGPHLIVKTTAIESEVWVLHTIHLSEEKKQKPDHMPLANQIMKHFAHKFRWVNMLV